MKGAAQDPERDKDLNPLPWRSLQIGLSGDMVRRYIDEWTLSITNISESVHDRTYTPNERPYPLPLDVQTIIGATEPSPTPASGPA